MIKRENTIAFSCGMKDSGKSFWLNRTFVASSPRVIHIDPNGDYLDDDGALLVDGYRGLVDALRAFAAGGVREWRVAVSLDDPKEIAALFDLVAPRANFGRDSLSRALGGLAIECGECDVIAPNGSTPAEVQSGWRRGRHHGLDLFMGTQRPASCDRLLTSQADIVAVFLLDEPIDIDWVGKKFGPAAAGVVASLPAHWHIEKRRGERELFVIDAAGAVQQRLALRGSVLELEAPG